MIRKDRTKVSDDLNWKPKEIHEAVLAVLARSDFLGSGDVARALRISQKEALAHLAVLEHVGLVIHNKTNWRKA